MAKQDKVRKIGRFLVIGTANTLIDLGILLGLTQAGLGLVPANMISTSVALVFSYFANRKYTFQAAGTGVTQVTKFFAVTLIGMWGLQPLVMSGILSLIGERLSDPIALIGAKVIATGVTLVWNFVLYQYFVFAKPKEDVLS